MQYMFLRLSLRSFQADSSYLDSMKSLTDILVYYNYYYYYYILIYIIISGIILRTNIHRMAITEEGYVWSEKCYLNIINTHQSQWHRGLRHEPSSPARTRGPLVRIPVEAWMFVCVYSVCVFVYVGIGFATG
jgi:hypothetical protein